MLAWQRHLRLGLGVFILLFAIGLFVSLRHASRQAAPAASPVKVDPKAVVQMTKGRVVWSKGTALDVVVAYERMLAYADGTTRLFGVEANIPQRADRDFVVTASEATVGKDQKEILLKGAVKVTASDGLALTTEEATYSDRDGVVRAPGPVAFSRNGTTGQAVGMTFDRQRDVLWLLDKAVIHMAPDEQGNPGADIEAGAAGFARADKYIKFERAVKIVRGGQTTTANEATANLADDGKTLKLFALRGSSRVMGSSSGEAASGLEAMAARDIDLYYGPDGQKLQQAVLTAEASIQLAGPTPGHGRSVAAEWIDVALAADGTTVRHLSARDRVQLGLPAEEGTPARIIRSATLEATGEEGKGLTAATFRGAPVEFREMPPPPAKTRLARSGVMDLAMAGNFGTIETARFGEGVRFEEGDLSAVARDGRYTLKTGLLNLTGIHQKTRQPPRVVDERATIEATTIDIELDGRKIVATANVKSEMQPARRAGATGGTAPTGDAKMPALLKQDQPVSATAAKLVYDGEASHAVYSGGARLWQGNTTIKGDEIVLDDKKGDLSATGNVITNLTPVTVGEKAKADGQGKAEEPGASLATAKRMVYEEELRRVTYTTDAHLIGPEGDLSADRIELFLAPEGSEVERIEGYSQVLLKTKDGRTATGARVTYFAPDERYVMHGTPVKIVEECRETTGRSLTFFRSADRIIVDGNEQKRTETKGASACGSGPRSSD